MSRGLQRVIDALPLQSRRAFVLRRVHGRSSAEIAAEMDITIPTVEADFGQAMVLLMRTIVENDPERCAETMGEEGKRLEIAAHHLARHLDGEPGTSRAERMAWLSADPRNAVAYACTSAVWDKAAVLAVTPPGPDHDQGVLTGISSPPQGADQQ